MHSLRSSELTAVEAVDCECRYVLLVMQARNDDDDDDDCTWKSRVLSRFREILHYSLIVRILENSNFT